ncbi:MAG: haloacid dehalogenase-like hydrolase [Clostridia bacterium]|nr:haloacid dehalogenase-like hydrolase [Clostridia bacterium]
MRAFDFDQTIYKGYSYRDFCFFVTARKPWLALYLPVIIIIALMKLCRLISMKHTVEIILFPYLRFKNIDKYIVKFWDKKEKRIQQWYKDVHHEDDLIISASPKFFLEEICRRLGVKHLIATEIDRKTGKVVDPYCYRDGKWKRFKATFGEEAELDEYYTDTLRDEFMLNKAKKGFFVKKGVVTQVH